MVVPARKVDLMAEPGPYASTQRPQVEYDALASVFSDAATARNTPEFQRLVTAWSSADDLPPPSDMFATAGLTWFALTQSTPAITSEFRPMPAQLRTRTPCSETPFATP